MRVGILRPTEPGALPMSPPLRIALGADHGGFADKRRLIERLRGLGYRVLDLGAYVAEASDYPIPGRRVAEAVARGRADLGVLLCRSGNGMAIVANKVPGARAAIATNVRLAELARRHNDANVLVLGSDFMEDPADRVLEAFLSASPEDGRHRRRVDMIRRREAVAASTLPTHQLLAQGQSPWVDDISDQMLASGLLERMIRAEGLRGLTSNPSIFEKAITSGQGRYRAELARMKTQGLDAEAAYERLTTEDIARAADLLRPIYDETGGDDGFVSLEVLPAYAHDEESTVKEARRLFEALGRPNVMIKVPGTEAGLRAFRRLTALGVNINVTLIFARSLYGRVAEAYLAGLADRLAAGGDVSRLRSVASVFVSRIDSAVDKRLEALASPPARALLHTIAIANARLIYADFKSIFDGEAFAEPAAHGAAVQRPLWGSTSTKDPRLSDVLYVEELIGPETVNTIPLATLQAFLDHGRVRGATLEENLDAARERIDVLPRLGVDLEAVCAELQTAGVRAFADSFDKLFAAIQAALA